MRSALSERKESLRDEGQELRLSLVAIVLILGVGLLLWRTVLVSATASPDWEGVPKEDLFVDIDAEALDHLLDDWSWKVGDQATVFRVTIFGDVFTQASDGHIYLLDTASGNYVEVAQSVEKWTELFKVRGPEWLRWKTLQELRTLGVELPRGHVFSWQQFPMIGGSEEVGNVDWVPAAVHISASGQLAEAIKNQASGRHEPRIEDEDTAVYSVVINSELQYSIWPVEREMPSGWKATGKVGAKQECLDYIKEVWTDMRPLSLRKKMDHE